MKTMKTLLSASLALTALSGCQPETEKPNILFLLVDDMQSDAIAALGNKNVYTPNIDGLIAEGVTFTRTYTNGALCGALSMPSRAMLMTGRGVFEVSPCIRVSSCRRFALQIPPSGHQHGTAGH